MLDDRLELLDLRIVADDVLCIIETEEELRVLFVDYRLSLQNVLWSLLLEEFLKNIIPFFILSLLDLLLEVASMRQFQGLDDDLLDFVLEDLA